jgi:putative DNA primase/helicase
MSDSNKLLDAALAYARRGLVVFPLSGKVPFANTHGHLDASMDESVVRGWWKKWPNANVGLPTGSINGFFVIDGDGPEGRASREKLIAKHGPLPETYTVRTGRDDGGLHEYLEQPIGVRTISDDGFLGLKFDVKGDGGYVCAPPSIHPDTGREYTVTHNGNPAVAPSWLLALVRRDTAKQKSASAKTSGEKIPKGKQDKWLASRAGLYLSRGDSAETIEKKLLIDYHDNCAPPHDNEKKVRQVARSIAKYPEGELDQSPFKVEVAKAALFARRHAGYVVYCRDRGIWFAWDERRFAEKNMGEVMRRARETVAVLYDEAARLPVSENSTSERKAKLKRAINAESSLDKIVNYASSERALEVMKFSETFDLDHYLLNCANGILDLRTGELQSHDSAKRLTKLTAIAYDADATCPKFEKWLLDTCGGSERLKSYLVLLMGYCLSGLTEEICFWMFYGTSKTGKSTFVKILRHLLGEYATSLPESAVVVNHFGNPEHALAELANVRLATLVEIAQGKRYDEAKVKQITGQDWIGASKKYQNYFEFMSKAKLIVAVNHKPVVRETDDSFWNRVKPVPFLVFVPPEKRIPYLDEILIGEEGPGILALAARGFQHWRKSGLVEPPEVIAATAEYRKREDIVMQFIEEDCVIGAGEKVTAAELFNSFIRWKEQSGIHAEWSKTLFGIELERLGYQSKKSGSHFWMGLRLGRPSEV